MRHTTHMVCKHCSKSFMHSRSVGKDDNSGTTSSLSRHLTICKSYNTQTNTTKTSRLAARLQENQTTFEDYNNDSMIDKTLKFFISGNVAFNQADNSYFQDLIRHEEERVKDLKINRKSVRSRLTVIE